MVQLVKPVHFPMADRDQARAKSIRLYDAGRTVEAIADIIGWPRGAVHHWLTQSRAVTLKPTEAEPEPQLRLEPPKALELARVRLSKEIAKAKAEAPHTPPYRKGKLAW